MFLDGQPVSKCAWASCLADHGHGPFLTLHCDPRLWGVCDYWEVSRAGRYPEVWFTETGLEKCAFSCHPHCPLAREDLARALFFVAKDISSSCVRPMDNVYYCPLFPHDVGLSGSVALLLGLASPMLLAYAVGMVASPAAPAWLLERSHGILRVVSMFSHTRALLGSRWELGARMNSMPKVKLRERDKSIPVFLDP